MIIIEKQKEPTFHPRGEWDEQRCNLESDHHWKMCFWDTTVTPSIALAICLKCAKVQGGWAKYDHQ